MSRDHVFAEDVIEDALAIGPSALHKTGGMLTGHFLLNALILLSSSPKVKN